MTTRLLLLLLVFFPYFANAGTSFSKKHACGGSTHQTCVQAVCSHNTNIQCSIATDCSPGTCEPVTPIQTFGSARCENDNQCITKPGLCRPVKGLEYDFWVNVTGSTKIYEVCIEQPRFGDSENGTPIPLDDTLQTIPTGWARVAGTVTIDGKEYICWKTTSEPPTPITSTTPENQRQFHISLKEGVTVDWDGKTWTVGGGGQASGQVRFRTSPDGTYKKTGNGEMPGGLLKANGDEVTGGSKSIVGTFPVPSVSYCNEPAFNQNPCGTIDYILWDLNDPNPSTSCSVGYDGSVGKYVLNLDASNSFGGSQTWPHYIKPPTSGGTGTCFVAGTSILLADGSTKPIESIEVGDYVVSVSEDLSIVSNRVSNILKHTNNGSLLTVTTEEGRMLIVTPEHRVWSADGYIEIGKLNAGNPLLLLENGELRETLISSIELIEETTTVYNFEVEYSHTYFAEGLLVHNTKLPTIQAGQNLP